ncbi:exported hypothetical protein [Micromonospora lupini str. Lupac 08]|uniref:Uncharacterized protein n=1 Tax=Micromonospora lupini str. Lupac 08 TaxID=1150864 RepID=I0KZF7_9ACTN|nr:exported hypothetical protein [Micromonospora lupini str. Lupac 08]
MAFHQLAGSLVAVAFAMAIRQAWQTGKSTAVSGTAAGASRNADPSSQNSPHPQAVGVSRMSALLNRAARSGLSNNASTLAPAALGAVSGPPLWR